MNLESKTRTRLFIGLENQNGEIHPQEVIDFIKERVNGGTFYESKGLWKGSTENSIVFESVNLMQQVKPAEDQPDNRMSVRAVADLKELLEEEFKQDSVMVEQSQVEVTF